MCRPSRLIPALAALTVLALAGGAAVVQARSPAPLNVRPARTRRLRPVRPLRLFGSSLSSVLSGVACPSRKSCWAVGQSESKAGAYLNQLLHFAGKGGWTRVKVKEPGGSSPDDVNDLYGDTCLSVKDCWAVGDHATPAGALDNEILHWNGSGWSQVAAPEPGGSGSGDSNVLYDVACSSPTRCWAIGDYQRAAYAQLNQVLRWNGKKWIKVAVPNPAGASSNSDQNMLLGDFCYSAAECWAVGQASTSGGSTISNEALRWDGKRWTRVPTPRQGDEDYLDGMWCSSAESCWAAGGSSKRGAYLNQLLRWNGKSFSRSKAPDPGGRSKKSENFLYEVVCPSGSECWAIGNVTSNLGKSYRNEILRWDGKKWSPERAPNPVGTRSGDQNILDWVACSSASDCWAVGNTSTDSGSNYQDEELRWGGKKWSAR